MKSLSIVVLVILCCFTLYAQDPHFSQYYASPLTLNPANTGFFDGDLRVALNERQQWWNVGYNYNTTSASADLKLFKEHIPLFDNFAVGFSGIFENSINGALQSNFLSLSSAYHKSLAYEGSQTLGLGIQINYTSKYFDYNKLSFATQFNGKIFDPTIPVNINYSISDTKYFDLNAGLLYAIHLDQANLYAGTSLYHLTKPKETLFNSAGSTLALRKTLHGGGEINLSAISSILFSGYYMEQDNATDSMVGGAYGLKLDTNNEPFNLYVGLWYRLHDSYIPYLGADYQNFSLGLNYGASAVNDLGFSPQTFEISLIYRYKSHVIKSSLCPRF